MELPAGARWPSRERFSRRSFLFAPEGLMRARFYDCKKKTVAPADTLTKALLCPFMSDAVYRRSNDVFPDASQQGQPLAPSLIVFVAPQKCPRGSSSPSGSRNKRPTLNKNGRNSMFQILWAVRQVLKIVGGAARVAKIQIAHFGVECYRSVHRLAWLAAIEQNTCL
jgi:hypothetical protein